MFMTRSLNVTPKTTELYLIVRSDKSVAYVTNNKRLRSTFCTIEVKLLTDTIKASRGLFATAELLVKILSLLDAAVNSQQELRHISHRILSVSLHYLVKYKRSTIAIFLMYLTLT